ncbi:N-acetylmuramoyl-L-alanine amidase [Ascidiimonas aurantiaca]|uniref:N-acetylmuramoyl-L-alanine amidase family protein n=1 Tax=Ascidiimonas aurantiaca TaxID=1685432 RepID=UPI0030EEDAD2
MATVAQSGKDTFKVVLDAGHGGTDPGNLGSGYKEKDIALKIVLAVGAMLQKEEDIEVIYTRKTDVFVDLFVRGKIANEANADLFVSVHCNSHNSSANGTETFVLGLDSNRQNFEVAKAENSVIYLEEDYETNYAGYDINSPESFIALTLMQEEFLDQSIMLAKHIQENFTKKLRRKNRGVKQAGFIVLHQTFMPSVLVEVGFLTYKPEGRYLSSASGQAEIARSIGAGILAYKKSVQENVGSDFSFENSREEDASSVSGTNGVPVADKPAANAVFKVQIAAGSAALELEPSNFKGLEPLSKESFPGGYRYFYGETHAFDMAKELQATAIAKGYSGAFIVAYRDGSRITVEEAINNRSN